MDKILKAFNYKDIEENKKNIKEIIWKKNINHLKFFLE